ncbi:purine-nucleoside phosphorylase [Paenibacillus donghaensis]|uniref:purine-nucleoside phosphorylase n=1 Tax=Paenibacillus TaxID=44249 RepID=UPI001883DD4B|nr:purine-nucleoside phosphorylase [Paenibacillus donghaensis]MBE9913933.1 purine-nucleoside phosphorylase [Paenibacillus donghaensis]
MSFHIEAKPGDIAEIVLLPGDPRRAKYIAETYLEDAFCYNQVRNIWGYTGMYKGKRISVQGTGMGMPSMSIYATELINEYGAKYVMRVGSSGSLHPDVKKMDIVLAMGACTNSNLFSHIFRQYSYAPLADFELLKTVYELGVKQGKPISAGLVCTDDHFYDSDEEMQHVLAKHQVLACDNETAALYMVAARYGAKALSILTVTDQMLTGETITPEERETKLNDMIELALETALLL